MKGKVLVSVLFWLAALYDGVLGVAFLFAPGWPFGVFNVTPPNHFGYVQFPAALLIIFGLMFLMIALRPVQNRNLIPFGILLKIAYCGVVLYYWVGTGIPDMWKPFAWIDLVFLVLFVWAWFYLGGARAQSAEATAAG
jgi:hypothetical protein